MHDARRYAAPLGRVLLSAIFLMSGFHKITDFQGTVETMQKMGLTQMTTALAVGAIVFEVVGGLSLLLGYRTRLGAVMLVLFLIPTTLTFHAFWAVPAEQQQMQMIHFLKNLAILGGLLMVVSHGSGPLSLDSRLARIG
jgi:putative oxidoreductase